MESQAINQNIQAREAGIMIRNPYAVTSNTPPVNSLT